MPLAGLEPARINRLILSQVRLPIPPQRHHGSLLEPLNVIIIVAKMQLLFHVTIISFNYYFI